MKVVGGVYGESCGTPALKEVMGSGLRAAGALAGVRRDIELHCAVDAGTLPAAQVVADGLGVRLVVRRRSEPVAFMYDTPLSSPAIDGRRATADRIDVRAKSVLAFGMIECASSVRADRFVFDPQQPRDLLDIDLSGIDVKELAICANRQETLALGNRKSLRAAARSLLLKTSAKVIVTKCGAVGCLVTTAGGQRALGPMPSESVMPIGTGDVFAAAFAYAWGARRMSPLRAARIASSATSWWTASLQLPVPPTVLRGTARGSRVLKMVSPRVYLASPFFNTAERWLVDLVRDSLHGLGADTFSPLHDVGPGGDEVAMLDLKGLDRCDAVLALIDGEDGGTLFEAGWAARMGLPIVCLSAVSDTEALKMLRGVGAEVYSDLSTAIYRAVWRGMTRRQRK